MTTVSEIIRSRATQIGEIRRTGSQTLASALLRDLYIIAECIEVNKPAHLIAEMLSDSLSVTAPPPPADTSAFPWVARFQPQAWIRDVAVDADNAVTYFVSAQEVEAAGLAPSFAPDRLDQLQSAGQAPDEVKNWSGPFDVTIERRLYRIEQFDAPDAFDIYADTIDEARDLMRGILEADARTKGVEVPAPATAILNELSDREMIRNGGSIIIAGPAYDLRIVQQDPEPTAQTDAIV